MFEDTEYSYLYSPKSKNGKGLNKRRFNDEQIKSLESMFESETRLEPTKKLQVASDLGLQPRQVAIWFQNKRARWKSKQLESDYNILLSNFNTLTSRFEALKKEKHGLVAQLQKLKSDLKQRRDEEEEEKAEPSLSDNNNNKGISEGVKAECLGLDYDEPDHLLNIDMVEPADSSLTSPDEWDHLNSETLFGESTSGYDQWWDFWS